MQGLLADVGSLAISRTLLPCTSLPGEQRVAILRYHCPTATYYDSCHAAPHCSVYRALCSAPICHDFLVFIVKNEARNMLQMCRALFPFSNKHCGLCWLTSHLCSSARLVRADAMVTAQAACGLGHFLLLCSQFQVSLLYSPEVFF